MDPPLPVVPCPSCGRPLLDGATGDAVPPQVRCPGCGSVVPVLGAAGVAWASGALTRDGFLAVVAATTGDDVDAALLALAQAAAWWEARDEGGERGSRNGD